MRGHRALLQRDASRSELPAPLPLIEARLGHRTMRLQRGLPIAALKEKVHVVILADLEIKRAGVVLSALDGEAAQQIYEERGQGRALLLPATASQMRISPHRLDPLQTAAASSFRDEIAAFRSGRAELKLKLVLKLNFEHKRI